MDAQKFKVAVLGVGRWGPNLLRNLDSHPACEVVAVVDTAEPRLAMIQERFGRVKAYTALADMYKAHPDLDALVVCTPTESHFQIAKEAIAKGKHVFVEKPLATKVPECEELVRLAREKKVVLFVGHIFVYNSTIQAVKKYLDKGELGAVHYIHMTRTNFGPIRNDVSAFWDLAPHDLSILNYWFQERPIEVSAVGGNFLNSLLDDVTLATYAYSSGMLAHIHVSWLHPVKVREITIVGEKKMLVWDDMNLTQPIKIYDKNVEMIPSFDKYYVDTFSSFRASIHEGDTLIPKVNANEPLAAECQAFIKALKEPESSLSRGEDGLDVVKLLVATEESIKLRGNRVRIQDASPVR